MFLFRCRCCFEFWPLWAVTRNGTKLRFWEQFLKTYNPCCIKSENQLWYIALVLKNLRIDSDIQLHFNKKSKNHFKYITTVLKTSNVWSKQPFIYIVDWLVHGNHWCIQGFWKTHKWVRNFQKTIKANIMENLNMMTTPYFRTSKVHYY